MVLQGIYNFYQLLIIVYFLFYTDNENDGVLSTVVIEIKDNKREF